MHGFIFPGSSRLLIVALAFAALTAISPREAAAEGKSPWQRESSGDNQYR